MEVRQQSLPSHFVSSSSEPTSGSLDVHDDSHCSTMIAMMRTRSTKPESISFIEEGLAKDRFCHVTKVLVKDECDGAVERIWDFIEDTCCDRSIDRNHAKTWTQPLHFPSASSTVPSTSTAAGGTGSAVSVQFQNFGAGWVVGDVRELLAERVFEPLYKTKELHSSKEGFELLLHSETSAHAVQDLDLPSTSLEGTATSSPRSPDCVVSSNSSCNEGRCWRSLIVLSTGGFDACDTNQLSVTLVDTVNQRREQKYLSSGDVLIFFPDICIETVFPTHSASDYLNSSSSYCQVSAIMYCSMQEASDLSNDNKLWNKKIEAYKQRQTSDYCVYDEIWTKPSMLTNNARCYFRTGPPLLSRRLAELYALIPYHSEDWKREINRAVIRGVRFTDESHDEMNADVPSTVLPSNVQPPCPAESKQLTCMDPCLLSGQDKYLGGMAAGASVYGVPGTARRVLRISVETGEMDCIGPEYDGKFKWLRGVDIPPSSDYPDGCCIALPCNHLSFLKVVPFDATTGKRDIVYTVETNQLKDECADIPGWYYHGGNLASNGWIYCIPANANRVAKIHPLTDEVSFIGPILEGRQKWYGGIVGSDDCIYGIPHNAQSVLKIDPNADTVILLEGTHQPLPEGRWKWHGGLRAGHKIIGFPNNSDNVLVIDCDRSKVYTVGSSDVLQSGRHRIPQDGRYKYLGGALTSDGRFAYLFPCDAERILRIDLESDQLTLVGPSLLDGENKFQNGFCGIDGCLYGIPQRAMGVLRIRPPQSGMEYDEKEVIDVIPCGENMVGTGDKFEGGVMGPDDCIYCIPLRARACVKIIPSLRSSSKRI
jgi:hypothetical protein